MKKACFLKSIWFQHEFMSYILLVLFGVIFFTSCNSKPSAETLSEPGWKIDTLFDHWSFLALQHKDLPGQTFAFTIPEVFTASAPNDRGRGLFKVEHQPWILNEEGATMTESESKYAYSIKIVPGTNDSIKWINWEISFTNKGVDTVRDLAAFNCFNLQHAPWFTDTLLERTWVSDRDNNPVLLNQIQRRSGGTRRNMQFYQVENGIQDLSLSRWISHWDVISPATLTGKEITLISMKGDWKITNTVNSRVAYFFANSESTHGCIHAAPLIADELLPGQTAKAGGTVIFSRIGL
ncbi:MAG: hypothetical protein KIT80_20185 [Chitinophagaceae bacterium]|nr:hypothetical protein [Chitinophagaceae bacterium]MCW5929250.1 hypothetical protein [Chitinophagaceae bacterium]